jgi:hypothetical protein
LHPKNFRSIKNLQNLSRESSIVQKSIKGKCGKESGPEKRLMIIGTVELHDMINTKEQWAGGDGDRRIICSQSSS